MANKFLPRYVKRFERLRQPNEVTGNSIQRLLQVINGGPGSGFHGHKGIKGHRGGSLAEGASAPSVAAPPAIRSLFKAPVSESPQATARRNKNAYTRAARLAEVFSSHAESLEKKRKKKWTPLSKEELAQLADAHAVAADNFKSSAEQSTLLKTSTREEQQARLDKASYHQGMADKYNSRLGRRLAAGSTAKGIGKSFAYGFLGGSPEQIAARVAREVGQASVDIAATTARAGIGSLRKESGRTVTETKDLTMPESELKAAEALIRRTGKGPLTEKQRTEFTKSNIQTTTRKKTFAELGKSATEKMKNVSAARAKELAGEALSGEGIKRRQDLETAIRVASAMRMRAEQENALRKLLAVTTRKQKGNRLGSSKTTDEPISAVIQPDVLKALAEKARRKQAEEAARLEGLNGPAHNSAVNTLESLIANFSGKIRHATLHGREYIVAPLTMIVPGVLAGSKGPLLYPEDEVAKNPSAWNGMPIVVNHPMKNGMPVEARDPSVLESSQIGTVFNAKYDGKLVAEGWFDIERVKSVNSSILNQLINNKPMELSTGLFTDNEQNRGTWRNGRNYDFIARNYRPDHLAILIGSKGACSVKDGCGVLVNQLRRNPCLSTSSS